MFSVIQLARIISSDSCAMVPGPWITTATNNARKVLFNPARNKPRTSSLISAKEVLNFIGELLFNEKISIVDDGLFPLATGSQIVDDEGIPCRRTYLVEKGVLKNYILDLNSAAKLNMEPSGNGFRYTPLIKSRSYAAAPNPAFTNLLLPAGDRSFKDILKSADQMLLIDQLTGVLLGNLINGDWSGNIEYGILFEKGQPKGRIKNAMTGGNFYTMFKSMYAESSLEREWVSGFGGGAGSSYFPYTLFEKPSNLPSIFQMIKLDGDD